MFCPKCGTQLNDNSLFCGACGYSFQPAAQPDAVAEEAIPAAAPAAAYEPLPTKPISKNQFFFKEASGGIKAVAWIALILALLCAVAVPITHVVLLKTSVEDFSVMALVPEELLDQLDEIKERSNLAVEQYEDRRAQVEQSLAVAEAEDPQRVEQYREELEEIMEWADDSLDDLEAIGQAISIENFGRLLDAYEEGRELGFTHEAQDKLDEINDAYELVILVLLVFVAVVALLAALGGIFRLRVLIVFSMILSCLYFLPFFAVVSLLFLVAHIAIIVLISIAKSAYKEHCNRTSYGY